MAVWLRRYSYTGGGTKAVLGGVKMPNERRVAKESLRCEKSMSDLEIALAWWAIESAPP